MNSELCPQFIEDGKRPDYKIIWFESFKAVKRECHVFTYGQGKSLAIKVFKLMYPERKIHSIDKIA